MHEHAFSTPDDLVVAIRDTLADWLEYHERHYLSDAPESYPSIEAAAIDAECALARIDAATTNIDRLCAALAGASVQHTNGNILDDYGWDNDIHTYDLDLLRSEGLEAFFTSEQVREWLAE